MKIHSMKVIMLVLTAVLIITGFAGCDAVSNNLPADDSGNGNNNGDRNINFTETIKVYNAGEYIDLTTISDFEREFAIKVEYHEFESNETMYDEISKNPNAYDVLIPSDYTVDRLIKEGKLEKLDKSKLSSVSNVSHEYMSPSYDSDNDYVIPYMVGTLGILYNKRQITVPVDSWNILFNAQYAGKILLLDSQRDTLGAALKMLGYSMNSNDNDELNQAKTALIGARSVIGAYCESEEIRDRMVAGEGVLGVVYSGDAKTAIDRNPDLAYVIPKEGSNKWVDGFVITKGTQHADAAYKFIDFMCRSNIAVRNMSKIGYTSPIKGAWSEFNSNKIMFPSEEELERCEAFTYNAEAAQKYSGIWNEVR